MGLISAPIPKPVGSFISTSGSEVYSEPPLSTEIDSILPLTINGFN